MVEENKISIKDLKEGDLAVITGINGDSDFIQRLLEMGFLKGTELFIEKYAPLRDPIEIIIRGYHLTLRRKDAEMIEVSVLQQQRRRRRFRGSNFG